MGTQTVSTSSTAAAGHPPVAQVSGVAFEDVERVVERIQQELQVLRTEHAAIARRIGMIKNTVAGLAEVFGPGVVGQELQHMLSPDGVTRRRTRGLTDACRELLKEAAKPQTLKQITGTIQQLHPPLLRHHRYPGTVIQMMLRRLVRYGEAEEVAGEAGLRSWRSISAPR
jgi:hypothetical protein